MLKQKFDEVQLYEFLRGSLPEFPLVFTSSVLLLVTLPSTLFAYVKLGSKGMQSQKQNILCSIQYEEAALCHYSKFYAVFVRKDNTIPRTNIR
jgi:hypothetical protein